jgi:hypothetical protein
MMFDFRKAAVGVLGGGALGALILGSDAPTGDDVSALAKRYGTVPADTMQSNYFKIRADSHCVLTEDSKGTIGAKIFNGVTHLVSRNAAGRPIINMDYNIGGRVEAETDSLTARTPSGAGEYSGRVRMYDIRSEPVYKTPDQHRQAGERYTQEFKAFRADTIRHYMGDKPLSDTFLIAEAAAMEFQITSTPDGSRECSYLGGMRKAPLVDAPGWFGNTLGNIGAAVDWRPSGY